ncbi:MAG: hypothetical protein IPJ65_22310 [Archangiaceae bacterium]|nr:hypothetical protein [Archangiaceae bacterium]
MELRCALSGLPTDWSEKPGAVATMLMEEVADGQWVPLTPPVSDYGSASGKQVGERVLALLKNGALTTESPEDLAAHRKPGTKGTQLEKLYSHARAGVAKGFALRLDGHRVLPAVFLDGVGTAIAATAKLAPRPLVEDAFFKKPTDPAARKSYIEYLLAQNRGALAEYYRIEGERGTFGRFREIDPSFPLEAFRLMMHWAIEKRGGLKPAQPFEGDRKQAAREVWLGEEPTLSKLVATVQPDWVEEWKAGGAAATAVVKETRAGRAYSANERYVAGDVVTHPTFGAGIVEELVAPNKLRIRFGHELKTLVHKRG